MKKFLILVFVSMLGGIIALSAYLFFFNATAPQAEQVSTADQPYFVPANYNGDAKTNALIHAESPNFVEAAENSIHAVVHVKNTSIVSNPATFQDLFYGRQSQPRTQVGTGSGVIISPDGHIITNNHVIAGSDKISITLNDNRVYEARLVGTDEKTDIALLKIDADEPLPSIQFGDSDTIKVGEWVLAVGNPFNLTSTVTAGIISAKARDLSGRNSQSFLQTDAAVNPGNSGGALVNARGQLIGINTAISSQTGSYIGYSFAVPSNIARKVVEDIIEFGDVQNGILGVSILNRNSKEAIDKGINQIDGVYVSNVEDKSGAKKAGIKEGDIIKKLDEITISKFSDLSGYLKTKRPNDVVNVEVLRDGTLKTISVKLSKTDIVSVDFIDMKLQNLPDLVKKKYNIKNGVMVTDTENAFLYKRLGITRGTVITGINDMAINNIEDLAHFKAQYGDDVIDNIEKLKYIDGSLKEKEVYFTENR
ncbi:PDZ domain-containing protein [Subsaximicrobium wynnwilliamsii]|uniref:PDZ domain-containing protein n=1 Tax=Subsaximicrobium wynnwilliamsii TaxID=291179 RepID=A0A5C6ZJF8_9FLAO|nr:trypsin-like peptidase domain-containing protein [Subsaximicrobium wynnwilliamsii]TXD83026.1 PDZ domain-containing protein [Subsaximicrobium wynnwilliamsii]TXD88770.1 PDZ domain-containing protein [Subsaximicrobium wynnwilliamsii]TXE02843.1 PDZ domain-containing protein [Subsaximicrobium wynnwilliamsii]